jgi:hypothetical protein
MWSISSARSAADIPHNVGNNEWTEAPAPRYVKVEFKTLVSP